jgi:uncharacterized protein (DUF1330 family)
MDLQVGCYICPACPPGERWFTLLPDEYNTPRQYSASAQNIVVDMVRCFKMSVEAAAQFGREVLHLIRLNATTVLDWLRTAGKAVDLKTRQKFMVEAFSGQMAVDEVYDGGYYQLKATDPLNDLELAYSVGQGSPTKEDIREFLNKLKAAGFHPLLVVTDGSDLYPDVIKEVWPEAGHQRCVFHFIQQFMSVYLVSVCEITNMNDNLKSYAQKSAELITKYGGAYLIRGPSIEVLEGIQLNNKSLIIAEFPDVESIKAFLNGDEYRAIKHLRDGTGIYDIGIFNAAQ